MAPTYPGINKSTQIDTGGKSYKFPARKDYIDFYLKNQIYDSEADLFADHTEVVKIYRDWQASGQLACYFAQILAKKQNRPENIFNSIVITDDIETSFPGELICQKLKESIDDKKIEGLTILFPYIVWPTHLVQLCQKLHTLDGWNVDAQLNPSDNKNRMYVNIQAEIGSKVVSEVLGFAPFEFMPITRQAPFVTVEVRTKISSPKPGSMDSPNKVHFASITHDSWRANKNKKQFWENTQSFRVKFLGGDDSAAKAKVAFAIPIEYWDQN